jgi:peptidoglycan hydrolase-like protein with peptidoglycan-binding domain
MTMEDNREMGNTNKNNANTPERLPVGAPEKSEGVNPPPGNAQDGQQGAPAATARILTVTKPLMKGDDVIAVQKALLKSGLCVSTDSIAGIYGTATAFAVRHFQSANKLKVTGIVDQATALALGGPWTAPE